MGDWEVIGVVLVVVRGDDGSIRRVLFLVWGNNGSIGKILILIVKILRIRRYKILIILGKKRRIRVSEKYLILIL